MASQRSHVAVSGLVGLSYAAAGIILLRVHPEFALLSIVLACIAGIFPNIGNGTSSPSAQALTGFMSALAPLLVLEFFPQIRNGGITRIVLVVLACYILTRYTLLYFLSRYGKSRGILHSIPAAILAFELTYLMFWDALPLDRLYLGGAALAGYGAHLILDGFSNFDLTGTNEKKPAAMKVGAGNWGVSIIMYLLIMIFGWYVAGDLYPQIQLQAPINV